MKRDNNQLDPVDQALYNKLASSEAPQAPLWDDFVNHKTQTTTPHTTISPFVYRIGSVAAMVMILFAVAYLFYNNSEQNTQPVVLSTLSDSITITAPLVALNSTNKTKIPPDIIIVLRETSEMFEQQTTTTTTNKTTTTSTEKSDKTIQKKSSSQSEDHTTHRESQKLQTRPVSKKASPFAVSAYSALGYGSNQSSSSAAPSMARYTIGKYEDNIEIPESQFNHKFPVTVGISFQYGLGKRFSIHTGIMYSYLESTAKRDLNFLYQHTRRNHYLGIPLGLSYSILDTRRVELYATVGAMAEWSLSSKLTSSLYWGKELISTTTVSERPKDAIFSANAAFGVNVKILPQVGIYLEPGVSHYFENSSHPVNFRTQWPVQFNLRAGIRIRL